MSGWWLLLYVLLGLVALGFAFFGVVLYAVRRRQKLLAEKVGPLDLTGKTFRNALKKKGKELKESGFDAEEALGYDPEATPSYERFLPIKLGTQCIFAKGSKLWASKPWVEGKSLEWNVSQNLVPLELFLDVAKGLHYDGFLLEIRGKEHTSDVHAFGDAVRRALTVFSEHDPSRARCMFRSYIGKTGWWFEHANEPIFVTSFARCYPKTSPRYAFDCDENSCFILFQPEYSFAWKDLEDARIPVTHWDNPVSARDKVRVAFKNAGRNYVVPGVAYDPIGAHQVVRPLTLQSPELKWWVPLDEQTQDEFPESEVELIKKALKKEEETIAKAQGGKDVKEKKKEGEGDSGKGGVTTLGKAKTE